MKRRSPESGFALLLIFVLAAGIAIALMTQMPRVCFETQRDREQMLIDRGEQYKRAIGLYVRKWNRYPGRIEDLESTNNIRYLRRRYVDPMTGKDEWRLIHAGPGGVLTDSLVKKAPGLGPDGKPLLQSGMPGSGMNSANMNASNMTPGSSMNANPGNTETDANGAPVPPEVNQAVKARPSDRVIGRNPGAPAGFDPSQPNFQGQQGSYGSTQPPAPPLYPQYPQPGQPGVQAQGDYSQVGQPGFPQPGQPGFPQPGQPGFSQPGQPGQQPFQPGMQQAGQAGSQQPNIDPSTGQPLQPGQPGYQQPVQPVYPQPGQPGSGQPGYAQPGQPGYVQPGQPGYVQPGQPGYVQPGQPMYGQPGQPGFPQAGQPGFPQAGQPGFPQSMPPGFPRPVQPNSQQPTPYTPAQPYQPQPYPGQSGFPQPGQTNQNQFQQPGTPFQPQQTGTFSPITSAVGPGTFNSQPGSVTPPAGGSNLQTGQSGQTTAAQMIQQILTLPRQPPQGVGSSFGQQQALGAGIAGVATNYKSPSIKIYDERQKYQEWEFVYDPRKEAAKKAGLTGKQQNPANPGNKVTDTSNSPTQTSTSPSTFNRNQ